MTRKELETNLEGLGLNLNSCNEIIKPDGSKIAIYRDKLHLGHLGIKIIPEMPEITQENLCKFIHKHRRLPEVDIGNGEDCLLYATSPKDSSIMDSLGSIIIVCTKEVEITDPSWSELLEGE